MMDHIGMLLVILGTAIIVKAVQDARAKAKKADAMAVPSRMMGKRGGQPHRGLKKYDIVDIVTDPRQEEISIATVLELTTFEGEDAARIQYHYNSCEDMVICTRYMRKHHES